MIVKIVHEKIKVWGWVFIVGISGECQREIVDSLWLIHFDYSSPRLLSMWLYFSQSLVSQWFCLLHNISYLVFYRCYLIHTLKKVLHIVFFSMLWCSWVSLLKTTNVKSRLFSSCVIENIKKWMSIACICMEYGIPN